MSTINGVNFNMKNGSLRVNNRNVYRPSMGSVINSIHNTGIDGVTIEFEGFETSQSDYDDVMGEFFKGGVQKLVITPGWEYRVYSTNLRPSIKTGIGQGQYLTYRLSCTCKTAYQYSTEIDIHGKSISTNNQEWTAGNAVGSLLLNPDFEHWLSGYGNAPDYWVLGGSATCEAWPHDYKFGTYSCAVTATGFDHMYQGIPVSFFTNDSSYVTFGAWVKSTSASRICIDVDGVSAICDTHTGDDTWQWLECTRKLNFGENVYFRFYPVNATRAMIDTAVVVEGGSIGGNHTFIENLTTDGNVEAPVNIKITANPVSAGSTTIISQTEGS